MVRIPQIKVTDLADSGPAMGHRSRDYGIVVGR
jgi:hypothetical protein